MIHVEEHDLELAGAVCVEVHAAQDADGKHLNHIVRYGRR